MSARRAGLPCLSNQGLLVVATWTFNGNTATRKRTDKAIELQGRCVRIVFFESFEAAGWTLVELNARRPHLLDLLTQVCKTRFEELPILAHSLVTCHDLELMLGENCLPPMG